MSQQSNPMQQADASRIQSAQAKAGEDMSAAGFAARAQAAAARNDHADKAPHDQAHSPQDSKACKT